MYRFESEKSSTIDITKVPNTLFIGQLFPLESIIYYL